ncbi:tubulin polyglutamylase TTLL7-like isoform X3 [Littorina saxatilis]|uniref:tubulin polyglutamylase TTLL7-like isoform X3 n=1 Tax=Littorina saxatilis TaxID=31220 RepID=UPI0038B5ECF6
MDTDRDDLASSSSSESETEADEDEYQAPTGNSAEELTLQDDERSVLLLAPPEDEDLGEGEAGPEDQDTQYEEEGEGEGAEEPPLGQTPDSIDKKELDKKKKKKKKKKFLYICLTNCKYDVVRRTARRFGFKEVSDDEDWSLYWTDFSVALERVMDMKKYQKINHFPGMNEICRKDLLARNLNRMMKMFPKEYNIFPKTWCLPADYGDFQAYTRQKKNKTYILKPESGCQGRGIWITKNPKDIKPHEHMICQVYTNKPFLIDGFKFDFRIYTLVTSCDPLRIFVFKDGLARFATNKYCEPTHNNTENVFMHLTNYAINKNSEDFVRDDEAGSKRRISTINRYLQGKGIDVDKMWTDIDDTIIKTLISAHSVLKHNYRTCFPNHVRGSACFEILGFDVLLDRKLRPYVIEVNHSPSFGTDAQLDREIKGTLIWDTLGLINFGAVDRRRCLEEERRRIKDRLLGKNTKKETKEELEVAQQQYLEQLERYESNHMGNFRRIFPIPGCEKYDKFFHSSGTLFQETAAFRARSELARQQREEILRKKEKMELMLKKGKRGEGGVRPESPTWRRKRPVWHRNPTIPFKPRLTSHSPHDDRGYSEEAVDTQTPMDILEEEELERISGLLQRDNLVRGLGIVEHVYRLLHCTPGTVGIVKPDPKPQPLSLVADTNTISLPTAAPSTKLPGTDLLEPYSSHPNTNIPLSLQCPHTHPSSHLAHSALQHASANSVTYNAATNRFSPSALSEPNDTGQEVEGGSRTMSMLSLVHARPTSSQPRFQHSPVTLSSHPACATNAKVIPLALSTHHRSQPVRPSRFSVQAPLTSTFLRGSPLSVAVTPGPYTPNTSYRIPATSSSPSAACQPVSPLPSPFLGSQSQSMSVSASQPGVPGSQRWPIKSKSLGNINERTVPAYQERYFEKGKGYNWQYRRNKMARKPMTGAGVGARGGVVVQESDLRSMSGMVDTEAERNRLLARSGYNYHQPSYSQAQSQAHQGYTSSGYQSDWRSDSSTPARTRVLSAHLQQRESEGVGVTRFITQHPSHGLSVVSAPAPVVQRPDIGSPSNPLHRRTPPVRITGLDAMNTTRSTKSQRIRGASNTMRLRQMEMRENHAFAFS